MELHLSPHDGVPIYLQIVNQVKYLVAAGRLAPGTLLPEPQGVFPRYVEPEADDGDAPKSAPKETQKPPKAKVKSSKPK